MVKIVKTLEDLEKEIKAASPKVIIIDFFAQWCGPCKLISPKLEQFAKVFPNVVLLKVDVDESESIAEKYEVSAMPTFVVLKNGTVADTVIGANADKVEDLFKKYNEVVEVAAAQ